MLMPPLQIKAAVFNISCTHRQKRQNVYYSFVNGVYLSAIKECLWTSDKSCRAQVFPSAGSTNCRPNVSWARRPKSQQAAQKAPPLCFPPGSWWAAYLPSLLRLAPCPLPTCECVSWGRRITRVTASCRVLDPNTAGFIPSSIRC